MDVLKELEFLSKYSGRTEQELLGGASIPMDDIHWEYCNVSGDVYLVQGFSWRIDVDEPKPYINAIFVEVPKPAEDAEEPKPFETKDGKFWINLSLEKVRSNLDLWRIVIHRVAHADYHSDFISLSDAEDVMKNPERTATIEFYAEYDES